MLNFPDICKKLRPILGQKIDNLYLEYEIADTPEQKKEIFSIVLALYYKYVEDKLLDDSVLLEVPKEGQVKGEYDLGQIKYPNKKTESFGLRDKDWVRHMCVSGMSGSGKTTFALRVAANFIKKDKPFWIFDWKKSFRQLLNISNDVLVFTVGRKEVSNLFKFNINKPPKGVTIDEWITILSDLLCEVYGTSYGVHKLLTGVLQKAYKDFGCYNGSENYPTWFQIKDRLEAMAEDRKFKGREAEWLTSSIRIAHSLTFGSFGETINDKAKYNIDIEELMKNKIVFELDALGTMEKKLFCSYLLLYIYKYKKSSTLELDNDFNFSIIVDEAHNIFLKEKASFTQETVTDTIYREIREYGIGLICLDQHISKISDTVLGNSSTNIAFQQILPQDVDCISSLMFLKDEKTIFTQLNVGQAIVKLTERFYKPFTIDVQRLNTGKKLASDAKLKKVASSHYLYKKRMKLVEDLLKPENLAKEVEKLNSKKIDPKKITLDAEKALKKTDKKNQKIGLRNHIQENIEDLIVDKLRENLSMKEIKKSFAMDGYKPADINHAVKHFNQSRKGKSIQKFLDMMDRHIRKITKVRTASYSKHINIDIIYHLEALQLIQQKQSVPTTALYKLLKASIRKGNAVKNSLLELGLIYIHESRRKRKVTKKIQLSDTGTTFMERLGKVEI